MKGPVRMRVPPGSGARVMNIVASSLGAGRPSAETSKSARKTFSACTCTRSGTVQCASPAKASAANSSRAAVSRSFMAYPATRVAVCSIWSAVEMTFEFTS